MASGYIRGVCPVLVTPMQADGGLDEDGHHRLIDMLVDAGVAGLWAMGSASEDVNIGWADRVRAVQVIAAATAGRIPVLFGTGEIRVDDILRFLDHVSGLKLAGVHVLYLDTKQGDARMIAEMVRLADRSEYPVWLYHNPKRGKPVTRGIIEALRDHPNVAGMKIGGYALSEMTMAVRCQTPTFQVIGAGGGQLFVMAALGSAAHTTSSASCWPEEYVKLWTLCHGPDRDAARAAQFGLIRLEESLPRTDNGEYAAEEKYILSLRGICADHVNPAYRRLTEAEQVKARKAVRDFGFGWAPAA